jgi:hypothetical protein
MVSKRRIRPLDVLVVLELYSIPELQALREAIEAYMDIVGNGYKREEVIKYLALSQMLARLPQVPQKERV